jgi:hypothetical protein
LVLLLDELEMGEETAAKEAAIFSSASWSKAVPGEADTAVQPLRGCVGLKALLHRMHV